MARRRIAALVGLVLLIVIALLIASGVSGNDEQALLHYNQEVSGLLGESNQQVGKPLFRTLAHATSKPALAVDDKVDELRARALEQSRQANRLETPEGMEAAQRDFSLAMSLRAEGLTKLASLVRTELGSGEAQQTSKFIAGAMELFVTSEVLYSERVEPLIAQTLSAHGVSSQQSTPPTHFLADLGWLAPATVLTRLTGHTAATTSTGQLAPGTHGSALTGVSVGTVTLAESSTLEPTHVPSGSNPVFVAMVEDSGENYETDVKVKVTVEAGGQVLTGVRKIEETQPGKTVGEEVPVDGVPLGVPATVKVVVEPVPGEANTENNRATYPVIFER